VIEDQSTVVAAAKRDLGLALRRGLVCRCPACGAKPLFRRFLKPVEACPSCGTHWAEIRADDFPAYLTILVLGHLLVPLVVEANLYASVPMMVQMIGWPIIAGVLALLMLQPAKGFVLGLHWAR
jgi:uncharacterized protein (DUF983 family)